MESIIIKTSSKIQLILASSSTYRKDLLNRLKLDFLVANPAVDEAVRTGESPEQLVKRLALTKAKVVADNYENSLIIGCDQIALVADQILGKPYTVANAQAQLEASSGKEVKFLTGICLYNSNNGNYQLEVIPFKVIFRTLSPKQISNYIKLDEPLLCAGSFKWEQAGIALFKSMHGNDISSLQGLPLITLTDMLLKEGISVL